MIFEGSLPTTRGTRQMSNHGTMIEESYQARSLAFPTIAERPCSTSICACARRRQRLARQGEDADRVLRQVIRKSQNAQAADRA